MTTSKPACATRTETDDEGMTAVLWMGHHFGITHHVPLRLLPLWKRLCCPRGWHALDEVRRGRQHYLSCDACDLTVHVDKIEVTYMAANPDPGVSS